MKKVKKAAFTIAFLDVLSNALVAILIVTLVRMQPELPGEPISGTYYISATSLSDMTQDRTIVIAVKFSDFQEFAHEPTDYLSTRSRLNYSSKMDVRVNFLNEPKLINFDEVIIYGVDPDFNNLKNKKLKIEISLPNRQLILEEANLNQDNEFKIKIIKNGKMLI